MTCDFEEETLSPIWKEVETMSNDVFRKTYTPVNEEKKAIVAKVKEKAQELYDILVDPETVANADGRALSIAKTDLESAIMWAVKGLTA